MRLTYLSPVDGDYRGNFDVVGRVGATLRFRRQSDGVYEWSLWRPACGDEPVSGSTEIAAGTVCESDRESFQRTMIRNGFVRGLS